VISVGPPSADSRPRQSVRGIVATAKSASLLDGAQQALAQGDAISAANLYRLALQYADDPTSRAYAQSGLNEARSVVADMHLKKARYEEKEAHWSEAVASYEKALDRRPDDPAICERLANALRQEGQDLLRAARLAELATNRMPRNAEYRRTLGLVYADAGLREKALEQFEKAFELEPSNEVTTRALASLRRKSR
jgi:tetratricopeptide (TPR) repeat protein